MQFPQLKRQPSLLGLVQSLRTVTGKAMRNVSGWEIRKRWQSKRLWGVGNKDWAANRMEGCHSWPRSSGTWEKWRDCSFCRILYQRLRTFPEMVCNQTVLKGTPTACKEGKGGTDSAGLKERHHSNTYPCLRTNLAQINLLPAGNCCAFFTFYNFTSQCFFFMIHWLVG